MEHLSNKWSYDGLRSCFSKTGVDISCGSEDIDIKIEGRLLINVIELRKTMDRIAGVGHTLGE